jgi:acyl carrier protein
MTQFCRFVAEILGVKHSDVGPETGPGVIAKWDSLAHIQLVAAIEETYKVQLTMDEIVNLLCVSDIVTLLEEKGVNLD